MVYLPTFNIKIPLNVGKYTIQVQGWYGNLIIISDLSSSVLKMPLKLKGSEEFEASNTAGMIRFRLCLV